MNLFTTPKPESQLQSNILYLKASQDELRSRFVGKDLREIEGPAAIVDVAVVKKNCKAMVDAVRALNVKFRAHVKTHKVAWTGRQTNQSCTYFRLTRAQTVEITRLQVEDAHPGIQLIVSTVAEAEHLVPYLLGCKQQGRDVNILYGIPPSSSSVSRLYAIRKILGPTSISFLIDHPSQLQNLVSDAGAAPEQPTEPIPIFVKADTGYHRAGLVPETKAFDELLEVISHAQKVSSQPNIRLHGFYSHNSKSYGVDSPTEALEYLEAELNGVVRSANRAAGLGFADQRFTLSVGATPSASSAQNLLTNEGQDATVTRLKELIARTQASHDVELHAGVYPLLDMQQIATKARPGSSATVHTMTTADIGVKILAEVLSTYEMQERSAKPEALAGAGTLALGREPCKSYEGWGVLAPVPWLEHGGTGDRQQQTQLRQQRGIWTETNRTGWVVARTSQEHGILSWEGSQEFVRDLSVGQRVLIWPNHACIALAGYEWILVVDGEAEDRGSTVVDVWVRSRGW